MRRFRLPRVAAVVLAALAAVVVLSGSAHQANAAATVGSSRGDCREHRLDDVAVQARNAGTGTGTGAVADAHLTAATGGLCSVPGIGDIGGLLGFCAAGSSGVLGDLNNVCQPSLPEPEPANAGIDAMVAPPSSGKQPATLYEQYGVAGDYWAATNLQCSDMTSLIGNNVAGMVFDAAKSIDRVTITVYQSAAGEGILSWLQRVTDTLITSLGKAIYFPYLAVVVILAAIWLAWQGLIRKRATRTIEGTVWMVVACAAAIFLIGKPAEVTGLGRGVSDGISQTLNVAFAKLPSPGPTSCVPLQKGDPQVAAVDLQLHIGEHGRRPERRRTLGRAGVQAMAGRRVRLVRLLHRRRQADGREHVRACAAVVAGDRRERESDARSDPGQAGRVRRHRQQYPNQRSGRSIRCSRGNSGRLD